jgi:hypothetical protein
MVRLSILLRMLSQQPASLFAFQVFGDQRITPQCERLEDGMQ